MGTLPGRLGSLRAVHVMTRDVIVVAETDTLESAVRKLKDCHITGAPVVNDEGRLVGILSLVDAVGAQSGSKPDPNSAPVALAHGEDTLNWDLYDRAQPDDRRTHGETVAQRMSQKVASVTEDAPLVDVARVMCDGHWHRVPVVDNAGSLTGIISTMDILAAFVSASEEEG